MDRLSFCRKYLDKLNFDEISTVYNLLTLEYTDGEQVFRNKMEYIESIFNTMLRFDLNWNDWFIAISKKMYRPTEEYIGIGKEGIYSYENLDEFIWLVNKKMNGEAMEMIEVFLEQKGIMNKE